MGHLRSLRHCTLPDIAFTTSRHARHMQNPTTHHLQLINHTLRYLNRTKHHVLMFPNSASTPRLTSYSDSDYAESVDRKSTSGAAHFIHQALVACISERRDKVALRTCEAEYITGSCALQNTLWLRCLLHHITRHPPRNLFDS